MSLYVLQGNRERVQAARKALTEVANRNPEERAARRKAKFDEVYAKSAGSPDEKAAYAGIVTLTQADANFFDLNIRADQFSSALIESTPIKIGEIAVFKERSDYAIRVAYGHLGGTPPQMFWQTTQTATQVYPFTYFSEEFEVPNLVNLNFRLEDFNERQKALDRVAMDMILARQQYHINMILGAPLSTGDASYINTALTTYFASTPFSGKNPFVLDQRVNAASYVTTNIIDSHLEGGLTKNVFMKQRTYENQADRTIENFFIPMAGAPWEAYWQQATVVAAQTGATGNADPTKAIPPNKWEELVGTAFKKSGLAISWFGEKPIFTKPLNILPAGYGICSTNEPAALEWDFYQESISDEEKIFGKRAMNRRKEARSIALAQPEYCLRNFVVQRFA